MGESVRDQSVLMEWSLTVLWTYLLVAVFASVLSPAFSFTTSKTSPPLLTGCELIERESITCSWEPGDTPATNYTLRIWNSRGDHLKPVKLLTCDTSGTKCTVGWEELTSGGVFCITITAHIGSFNISSPSVCQSGWTEVVLKKVMAVSGFPHCLNVTWGLKSLTPVSNSEIKAGELDSQIEFKVQGQPNGQVKNVTVKDYWFVDCHFEPDTSYDIRLRLRYPRAARSWSEWSTPLQGRTGEAAPSQQQLRCVFIERKNATCSWDLGDTPATNYTLSLWRPSRISGDKPVKPANSLTCSTSGIKCTVEFNRLTSRVVFCITVTAHIGGYDISTPPRCQAGRIEVKLPTVALEKVLPNPDSPHCLNVEWKSQSGYPLPVSEGEMKAGELNSQIEFKAQGEPKGHVENVTVRGYQFMVCHFKPDTPYSIRLRHRYLGAASPWSEWSKPLQGRTREAAPSAAPIFWRQVKETDKSELRLVSLLWKPLPRVLFYAVTCQTESAPVLTLFEGCRHVQHENTFCSLLLPAERCSCNLTASNSAGPSPAARLWLLGTSENEKSSPSSITASPLNDNSLEVRWTAPVNQHVSGFVVEWLAVRENSSNIPYWEKLNSSSTTLVITEGIKPMERYAVSVRVLYDEQQLVGKNSTQFFYTREGAPSNGPNVEAQQTSSNAVKLRWSPVPVEQLRGFLQNYILNIKAPNQQIWSEFVRHDTDHHTMENLQPGNYKFSMSASTAVGHGPAGNEVNVYIAIEKTSIELYVILPIALTSLVLVLMACLAQNKTVKQKFCQETPDPSNSTLSHWNPKTTLESATRLVIPEEPEITSLKSFFLGELEDSVPDQDQSSQRACDVETYSLPQPSPSVKMSENMFMRELTKAKRTSSLCSDILYSQPLQYLPSPLQLSPYFPSNNCELSAVSANDMKELPGGASAPSDSHLSPPSKQKALCPFQKQHQSLLSISDFSLHSSVLLSQLAEVNSSSHPVSQSTFNLFPLLQPSPSTHPDNLSDSFTMPFSPFHNSAFVDLSCCPMECDPYISA